MRRGLQGHAYHPAVAAEVGRRIDAMVEAGRELRPPTASLQTRTLRHGHQSSVTLLHPPLPSVGVPTRTERGCVSKVTGLSRSGRYNAAPRMAVLALAAHWEDTKLDAVFALTHTGVQLHTHADIHTDYNTHTVSHRYTHTHTGRAQCLMLCSPRRTLMGVQLQPAQVKRRRVGRSDRVASSLSCRSWELLHHLFGAVVSSAVTLQKLQRTLVGVQVAVSATKEMACISVFISICIYVCVCVRAAITASANVLAFEVEPSARAFTVNGLSIDRPGPASH